jgi:hypothetical protein
MREEAALHRSEICVSVRKDDSFSSKHFDGAHNLRLILLLSIEFPGSGHVGFMVDKVALGQIFSEYFGVPCKFSFHQLLHNHPHLSSGVCTIGQKWPQYLRT